MAEETLDTRPQFSPEEMGTLPTSPHLQIWRWTVTMASSITQRATGIALYAGMALLTAWITSAVLSESAYLTVTGFMGTPFGLFILVGFTWAQMFHLSKGILHLIWDSGHLIQKAQAKPAAWAIYAVSVLLTTAIWAVALNVKG